MTGEKIREARKSKKMTQEDLAKKLGVKRSVISKYETGQIEPPLPQLRKIADALNVTLAYFLGYGNIEDAQLINATQNHNIDKMREILGVEKDVLVSVLNRRELQHRLTNIVDRIDKLNPNGQQIVMSQISTLIDDLLKIPEFVKKEGDPGAVDPKENE